MERSMLRGSKKEMELFACGSRSRRRTRFPLRAKAAARLMAVVVFPTPPFWFAMAITIRCTGGKLPHHNLSNLFLVVQRLHRQIPGLADNVRPFLFARSHF